MRSSATGLRLVPLLSQDLTADLVDARIKQWMALAKPAHSYDQVAIADGVTPAGGRPRAADPPGP